uniref:Dual specificity protein phosphatase 14 n=1 Tax=Setaria digitata TaxID=48799 RepID=A0A915Q265_9BILA
MATPFTVWHALHVHCMLLARGIRLHKTLTHAIHVKCSPHFLQGMENNNMQCCAASAGYFTSPTYHTYACVVYVIRVSTRASKELLLMTHFLRLVCEILSESGCVYDWGMTSLERMTLISFNVNPEYAKITEVVRGLYICGVSSLTPENIRKYDISFIVNATNEVPNVPSLGNIPRVKLWLEDTPQASIYPLLDPQTDQIEAVITSGGNVLVHCVAGVSRSASVCLAFLTKFRCKSLRQAYQFMAQKRPLVRPNIGFWRQLIAYEQNIKHSMGTVHLIRDKTHLDQVIPDVYLDMEAGAHKILASKKIDDNENGCIDEKRSRHNSSKLKFQPVLEPVLECVEATA